VTEQVEPSKERGSRDEPAAARSCTCARLDVRR
jgi:hypothetical protein